jgi:hypothetical protein
MIIYTRASTTTLMAVQYYCHTLRVADNHTVTAKPKKMTVANERTQIINKANRKRIVTPRNRLDVIQVKNINIVGKTESSITAKQIINSIVTKQSIGVGSINQPSVVNNRTLIPNTQIELTAVHHTDVVKFATNSILGIVSITTTEQQPHITIQPSSSTSNMTSKVHIAGNADAIIKDTTVLDVLNSTNVVATQNGCTKAKHTQYLNQKRQQ